jgi:hypothetical protein
MASVRGRLRGSSLDPARTALPLIGTGQHNIRWDRSGSAAIGQKMEKKKANFTMKDRKRQPHLRKHLSQRKEVQIAFALAFCSTPFFLMVKGIKLKEKSKRKKKGVRIQAIIGRIRTRDPDPGHFGPDFDSGSGHGSAFTDPGPGARPKARTFCTFADFLRTFSDSIGT